MSISRFDQRRWLRLTTHTIRHLLEWKMTPQWPSNHRHLKSSVSSFNSWVAPGPRSLSLVPEKKCCNEVLDLEAAPHSEISIILYAQLLTHQEDPNNIWIPHSYSSRPQTWLMYIRIFQATKCWFPKQFKVLYGFRRPWDRFYSPTKHLQNGYRNGEFPMIHLWL